MVQDKPNFGLYPSDGQRILWDSIFESDEWLQKMIRVKGNPFLFGPELDKVGLPKESREQIYMTIHCGDKTETCDYDFSIFLNCLWQPYDKSGNGEITLNRGIILNVSEIESPEDPLQLDSEWLLRLISKSNAQAPSQYSFYKGNQIFTLLPSHITAVGGPPYNTAILKYGYAITIPHGGETWHVIFESSQNRHAVKFDCDRSGRLLWMKVKQPILAFYFMTTFGTVWYSLYMQVYYN
ncbi:hypothetical protein BGW36DRAFT_362841 [Talaromyces proteolyticus]|uniref:Uncharacterized protein n=1 Tax=Talaromyces proteolyticus TaxID=1131652 RepID=A0AAD4KN28_9EURO|nr:uncharacterized protein BGW36DRAFT_362841 [Talaromyces proteolyticus]KAH8691805.1 hypothetical protein BGW36DRAFT_362841 [Talaromyces proteolyticus]